MRFRTIFIVLVYAVVLHPFSVLSSDRAVKLATQREGNKLAETGEPFVRCAMEKINMPYEIVKVPWARAQRDTKEGLFDGFFMASRNSKRDAYAIWSKPFVTIKWLYVIRKDAEVSPDQLSHLQFAANLGSARLAWLKEQYKQGKLNKEVYAVDTNDQVMRMLTNRRIDVALMNNFDLDKSIKSLSIDPLKLKTFVAQEKPTALYFSRAFLKANPGFLDDFNAYLASCLKEQE